MSLGRARLHRPGTPLRIATAMLGVVVASLATGGVATASPAYTLDDRATAIASPALVYLEAQFEGYLRLRTTGATVESKSVVVTRPCSGFVVGSGGYVVTTAHCLVPSQASLRTSAINLVVDDMVKDKKLPAAQKSSRAASLAGTTDFTGASAGSAPVSRLYGQLFEATGGLTGSPAVTAQVVETRPAPGPDLALVKLAETGLPAVLVDSAQLAIGDHVTQIAFGTDNVSASPVAYTARSAGSTIVGTYGAKSPPVYKTDKELGGTAYGGMVVNSDGHVVGVIDAGTASDNRSDEMIAGTSVISDMLAKAGVKNERTAIDQTYLAGLDAYYAGRYSDAIKQFDSVLAAEPNHKLAQSFRQQAQQRRAIEGDDSGTSSWLPLVLAGLGGVVLAGIITVVVLAIQRRSRRAREQYVLHAPDPFAAPPHPLDPFAPSSAPMSAPPGSAFPSSGAGAGGDYPSMPGAADGQPPYVPAQPPYAAGQPTYADAQQWYASVQPPYPPVPPGAPVPEAPSPQTHYQAGEPAPEVGPWGSPVGYPTWTEAAPIHYPEAAAADSTGPAAGPSTGPAEPGAEQDAGTQATGPGTPWAPPQQREGSES